ncbi:hypothetical protein EPO05_06400 [Patescibacteria group bacterium]|nr:MAG: hypothetical protein EPO05_06400 [Patescibacteria group bacterium]
MLTELTLRNNPSLIEAFTGIPADVFWAKVAEMAAKLPEYEDARHSREGRQRAIGAGRKFAHPLAQRVVAISSYLRLHVPQAVIGLMFEISQYDISRDLRRLLPLIQDVLPCPDLWEIEKEEPGSLMPLTFEQLTDAHALVDATEQRVSRPGKDNETRKQFFSGKKKAFTIKTQLVTDGEHHIVAITTAVPGAVHDKKLSDKACTLERLPDGCEVEADKGYQGMAEQVSLVTVVNPETGKVQEVPRITVRIPFKKPKGKDLTKEERAFNHQVGAFRVRVEHCIGWAKNWAILANRFRCDHSIYTSVMRTICGLVNAQTQRWQAARASANCA